MAKLNKLSIQTPVGEFTRASTTKYMYAVVRTSERAMASYRPIADGTASEDQLRWSKSGVTGRWVKDRGFAVTWHGSKRAAEAAASKPYVWDNKTTLVGIFNVFDAAARC